MLLPRLIPHCAHWAPLIGQGFQPFNGGRSATKAKESRIIETLAIFEQYAAGGLEMIYNRLASKHTEVVQSNGEAIVALGTRKAESASRARVMQRLEKQRVRDKLNPHTTLTNAYV